MLRPTKKNVVLYTILHLLLWFVAFLSSFSIASARFDNPDYLPTWCSTAVSVASKILCFPLLYLWTPWASKNLPNFVEWLALLLNSLIWGYVFSLFVVNIKSRIVDSE